MLTWLVPRWIGAILVPLYLLFVIGGYVGGKTGFSTTDQLQGTTDSH